jgi:hypothetical protein
MAHTVLYVQFLIILKKMRILVKWCHEIEEGWTHYHLTRYNSGEVYQLPFQQV